MPIVTQIRARNISIDMPADGMDPWIQVVLDKVERDSATGKVLRLYDRWGVIHQKLSSVAFEPVDVGDVGISLNVLQVSEIIRAVVVKWMLARYPDAAVVDGIVLRGQI